MSTPSTPSTTPPEGAEPPEGALPPPPRRPRWQGPTYPAGRAAWLGTLAGGAAMALALPLSRPGIGWLLVGLVAAGVIGHAARFGPIPADRRELLVRVGWTALALALLAVGAFRNASWLFIICVLGALGCASLAIVGGRSVRAIQYSVLVTTLSGFAALPWLAKGGKVGLREREKKPVSRALVATAVTIVLLVIFGALFASADAAFAKLAEAVLPELSVRNVFRIVIYTVVGGALTAGAIYLVLAPPNLAGMDSPAPRAVSRIEVALPLGGLVVLFTAFVAVQVRYLFGGAEHVQETTGLTFAAYAVRGFWQLVIVTLLTLAVIGVAARFAPKATGADRMLLRSLLGVLVALSLVIVGSAGYRMWLYLDAFGWTRERLFFGTVELWLGLVFLFVLIAGIRLKAAWFPRAVIASFAVMLVGLAVINPELRIAEQNVARFERLHDDPKYLRTFDVGYLRWLTTDAVDALVTLPEPYRSCALIRIDRHLKQQPESWYSWNLSRSHARDVLATVAVDPSACAEVQTLRRSASR